MIFQSLRESGKIVTLALNRFAKKHGDDFDMTIDRDDATSGKNNVTVVALWPMIFFILRIIYNKG